MVGHSLVVINRVFARCLQHDVQPLGFHDADEPIHELAGVVGPEADEIVVSHVARHTGNLGRGLVVIDVGMGRRASRLLKFAVDRADPAARVLHLVFGLQQYHLCAAIQCSRGGRQTSIAGANDHDVSISGASDVRNRLRCLTPTGHILLRRPSLRHLLFHGRTAHAARCATSQSDECRRPRCRNGSLEEEASIHVGVHNTLLTIFSTTLGRQGTL